MNDKLIIAWERHDKTLEMLKKYIQTPRELREVKIYKTPTGRKIHFGHCRYIQNEVLESVKELKKLIQA